MTSSPDASGAHPSADDTGAGRTSSGRSPARSRGDQARLILAGIVGGLAIAFAVLNVNKVEVDWIVDTVQTPLIVVIVVSWLVGLALGYGLARRRLAAGAPRTSSRSASAAQRT
jgi:uncharacterized integral membrane protein